MVFRSSPFAPAIGAGADELLGGFRGIHGRGFPPGKEKRTIVIVQRQGFTLIELILVMSMLVIVLSVSAPSLSRFFRGRSLDSEVNRFIGLTRYAQSRAVSEGIPLVLWIDLQRRAYGLRADSGYTEEDTKAVDFMVSPDVKMEVEQSTFALKQAALWKGNSGLAPNVPKIRFNPDGFMSESSPEYIVFRQADTGEVWVGPSQNRLNYEIQTNAIQRIRR